MIFARVVGNVVCTRKDDKLVGTKLLMVQPVDLKGQAKGNALVAIDAVGSGEGELVLLVQGSSARQTRMTEGNPVDCTIFAVVDSIEQAGKNLFRKSTDFADAARVRPGLSDGADAARVRPGLSDGADASSSK